MSTIDIKIIRNLVYWCFYALHHEVWSLKKTALNILSKVWYDYQLSIVITATTTNRNDTFNENEGTHEPSPQQQFLMNNVALISSTAEERQDLMKLLILLNSLKMSIQKQRHQQHQQRQPQIQKHQFQLLRIF